MTKEQVIDTLKQHKSRFAADHGWDSTTIQALTIAIDALDQPELHYDEWCETCKEYDVERHCCPRFNHVIRETVQEMRGGQDEVY